LVAAMNPCPAGRACIPADCVCSAEQQRRYRLRLSGPLLDRIDIRVGVPALSSDVLFGAAQETTTALVRTRVDEARRRQARRAGKLNASLGAAEIDHHCRVDPAGRALLGRAMDRLGISARGIHRILKLARTIADLGAERDIGPAHLAEALAFRESGDRDEIP
jgi:magnesium chelatase family protein